MINESRLMNIIRSLVISEKSTIEREKRNTLVFKVLPNATKSEIKKAVETLFNIEVESVNVLNMQGKTRRTVRGIGRRSDWKKAYVTIAPGQDLESALTDKEAQ